ncbi:MAG: aminopeptidase [Paludibacteraceae bacterium]|nr:aminopeptidase [Paludibacteraceae bacterium]
MRKAFVISLLALCGTVMAQNDTIQQPKDSGFVFTTVDSVGITPVKNQFRSGTCWCFSTLGFLESEVMRMNKGKQVDFSEMFVVSHTMVDRAEYAVRMYQSAQFSAGGSAYDVIYCMKHYGLVPQDAMPGIKYGSTPADTLPVHAELDAVAGGYVKALGRNLKKLTPVWKQGLQAVYDTYLGECPEKFTVDGKEYDPFSYVKSLGLNADDYVSITSYTHHPYSYEEGHPRFVLEVPDNWRMDQMYNVPMEDLMRIIDNAIEKGYTMAWGADVSETGFTRKGVAVVPDEAHGADITGSDMDHWLGLSASEKREELTKRPLPELEITQEMRQKAYDNWETTDDHGMQIFGTAKDQTGKLYYMIKNSWGTDRMDYKGIWYVSRAFMEYKTNDILVHKDAIPKDIRKKLGI